MKKLTCINKIGVKFTFLSLFVPGIVLSQKDIDSSLELKKNPIEDPFVEKPVQLSILPSIRHQNIYNLSLNALFSYSRGIRFANISGIGNIINGDVRGFQAAGLFNVVKKNVTGLQMVGGINYVKDTLKGVQIAGLSNVVNQAMGICQVAGGMNKVLHGRLNTQFTGVLGIADSIIGLQAAGIIGKAKSVHGVQLAGVLTIAKSIKGVQIGLINYTDSLNGLQIGLFNFSKHGGYHTVEASANEINYLNLSFKSGTRKFYTAFVGGITPYTSETVWTYGGGIGTMVKLSSWSDLNIEALLRHVNVGPTYNNKRQEWVQLGIYWNIRLHQHLEMILGPTNNVMFFDKSDINFETNKSKIFPSFISAKENGDKNLVAYSWVGGTIGLRFKF
jgi:hypothetical protein